MTSPLRRIHAAAAAGGAVLFVSLIMAPVAGAQGTGTIRGRVTDALTNRPVDGVQIYVAGTELGTLTNADGRCDQPLLDGAAFVPGRYRLVFAAGRYFAAQGIALPSPPFLDDISIDFGIADAGSHYHVPLLVSPWSYATYRGS